jgi:hypothetical protein
MTICLMRRRKMELTDTLNNKLGIYPQVLLFMVIDLLRNIWLKMDLMILTQKREDTYLIGSLRKRLYSLEPPHHKSF